MPSPLVCYARIALCAALALAISDVMVPQALLAQTSSSLTGSVLDPRGVPLPGAAVSVRSEDSGVARKVTSDSQGKYSFTGLAAGRYIIQVESPGFTTAKKTGVQIASGLPLDVPVTLDLGNVSEQVTVEANGAGSVAAALAPMDALLDERSARTEITQAFVQNFTSPLADYGEVVEMAPGTFTTNGNGVGLGQSKTFFRGFPDGDYDIDFDGIPFYDTNTPTHHSWAFFPSQWLGGVDFDRSPGTASTIGPTPFGGSIHLLSRDVSPVQNIRGGVSYGSWGTLLADLQFDSGNLGANHKAAFEVDVQHMDSKGYESNNFQNRNAGSIKAQYKLSEKTILSGFSGVVLLDANTPNFNATRCQLYGPSAANSTTACTISGTSSVLLPYTGSGMRFYLAANTDPVNYLDFQYNTYHVPTDFEYVGLHMERSHGILFDFKPYTYNYDNSEKYSNAVPITEAVTVAYNGNPASTTWYGIKVQPCNTPVAGILPCGVDKYNSYRKFGETATLSQVSRFGVLRAGLWYEWAKTNRHQFPSDPLNNWADGALPNFSEMFWNNSYQPFAEYEFHPLKRLNITAGTKFAYFTIATKQLPDNGKTIGSLNGRAFVANYGAYTAWLPSADANYRIRNNWSVYGQVSTGSIVPPSNVFDYNQTVSAANSTPSIGTAPKQQRSTTYQGGTVLKLKRLTFDMDAYHVKFQNSYTQSTTLDPVVFYLQPGSITEGLEAEGNLYFGHGFSAYLNATVGRAYYHGNLAVSCTVGTSACSSTTPQITLAAPAGLWVATTPTDTEAEGLTYQRKAWDFGVFNKRIGSLQQDNGAYHNQGVVNPFSVTNTYLNYTVRSGSHFDQTKIRLSVNNLLDEHNLTSLGLKGKAVTQTIASNGLTYTDPFNTNGLTPISGADQLGLLSGRSIVLSVTFGLSPKR